MAISPLSALNAYAAAASAGARGVTQGQQGVQGAKEAVQSHFSEMLAGSVQDATSQLRNAESLSAQAATGKAEMVDVVTAIAAAETSLETMLAVRDEVIRAYQEVMRMPI